MSEVIPLEKGRAITKLTLKPVLSTDSTSNTSITRITIGVAVYDEVLTILLYNKPLNVAKLKQPADRPS